MCPALCMSQRFMRDPFGIQGRMRMQNGPATMPIGPFPLCQVGFNRLATANNARQILSDSPQTTLPGQKRRTFAF